MKNLILLFATAVLLFSCKKDHDEDPKPSFEQQEIDRMYHNYGSTLPSGVIYLHYDSTGVKIISDSIK